MNLNRSSLTLSRQYLRSLELNGTRTRTYYDVGVLGRNRRDFSSSFKNRIMKLQDGMAKLPGSSFSSSSSSPFRNGILVSLSILGGLGLLRMAYDQALSSSTDTAAVVGPRKDESKATVVLQQSIHTIAKNAKQTNEVTRQLHQVDREDLHQFWKEQKAVVKQRRHESEQLMMNALEGHLQETLGDCLKRIPTFCDWYFSYSTNWKLLSLAVTSATKHMVTIRKQTTLTERVSADLQDYVGKKYQALVLRPALMDPQLQRAMRESLKVAHSSYRETLNELESSLNDFLEKQEPLTNTKLPSAYQSPPSSMDVVVEVDWKGQLQKVEHVPIAYEKSPTIALVGAGTVVGKLTGATATKAFLGKLASPFASKAVGSTLSSGAAASATGALAGGPLGAAAGAIVGVGVDMTLNAGVALMQRSKLEIEMQDALDAMKVEWTEGLRPELDRVHDIWFDSLDDLLSELQKKTLTRKEMA